MLPYQQLPTLHFEIEIGIAQAKRRVSGAAAAGDECAPEAKRREDSSCIAAGGYAAAGAAGRRDWARGFLYSYSSYCRKTRANSQSKRVGRTSYNLLLFRLLQSPNNAAAIASAAVLSAAGGFFFATHTIRRGLPALACTTKES